MFPITELQALNAGMVLLIVSLFAYVFRALLPKITAIRWLGWLAMVVSLAALAVSLVLRSQTAQYFALSNMYESLLVLILWMQAAFLLLDHQFRMVGLGWPVALLLLAALGFDTTLSRDIQPLQAALQSYWRSIHVPVIILSYAMFTLSFVSSLIYLVLTSRPSAASATPTAAPAMAGGGFSGPPPLPLIPMALPQAGPHWRYDALTYRCTLVGFPLLLIGIVLGGLWANEAWGNYWSWDPKESMSLATLLGYGIYLHLRLSGQGRGGSGFSPRQLAWVSIGAFVLLLITYFGVNLMGIGLHSYGRIG
jgi:cytochrome c-type biogenesis protein CcsB